MYPMQFGDMHIMAIADRARQIKYESMLLYPKPQTWSARMPAYVYTSLCLEIELQPKRK